MFDKFKEAYLRIIQEAALEEDPGLKKPARKRKSAKSQVLVNKDEIFERMNRLDSLSTVKTFNTVYVLLTDKNGYLIPQDFPRTTRNENSHNWDKVTWEIKGFEFKEYSNNTVKFLMNVHMYSFFPSGLYPKDMTYEFTFENVEPDIDYVDFIAKFKSIFLSISDIDSDSIEFCGPEHTPENNLIYECGESNYRSHHALDSGCGGSSGYSGCGGSSGYSGCGGSSGSRFSDDLREFKRFQARQTKWEKEQQLQRDRNDIWHKRVDELKAYGQFEKSSMMCINFLKPGSKIVDKAVEVLNEAAKKWLSEKIN